MRLLELLRPFRLVAIRRITDEEQVTVEAFARTREQAESQLTGILGVLTAHKAAYNEKVVRAIQSQVVAAETRLQGVGDQITEAEERLEKACAELARVEGILRDKKARAGLSGA